MKIRFLKSKRLADNMKGCKKVCVFGATLGTECDRLLRTYASTDITRATVLQACLASKIEEVCDGIEDELKAGNDSFADDILPAILTLI